MRKTTQKEQLKKIIQNIKNFLEKPEKVFMLIATSFGLLMLFLMPAFMVPDEENHFYRAYQVSEAKILSETVNNETGGYVRKVVIDNLHDTENQEVFIAFPSSAVYSPVSYVPQAVGINIGRVLHSSVWSMIIGGRLVNLVAYIFLVWLAIKIARHGKWVFAVIGLFPVAIQQAASLSTDVMTTGFAFVAIAFITNLYFQKTPFRRRQYLILLGLTVILSLTKQTNLIFLLPIVFLPKKLLGSFWKRIGLIASVAVTSLITMGAWAAAISIAGYNTDFETSIGLVGVNGIEQVKYIVTHPLSFVATLFRTYIFGGFKSIDLVDFYWNSMYGIFSWLTYKMPLTFTLFGYATLLIALLKNNEKALGRKIINKLAAIQTITFILAMIAIAGALYIVWTPVGQSQVAGIQGRYFIPLIPLLIPLFMVIGRFIQVQVKEHYMGILVSVVSIINLTAMALLTYEYFS